MKILNKLEFEKLLNSNPTKKFAFLKIPTVYISDFQISSGNPMMPGFGATMFDTDLNDNMIFFHYNWSIDEYAHDQMFAVLSDDEVKEIINLFSEVIKDETNR